ncbi:MAG TPA: 2-oxoglutarate dehydrogenase E1 component [Planctomycetota bacterium]|nr:2-oxoglutarate dehydrogenase E1 component [Planctomycetota bacterium]
MSLPYVEGLYADFVRDPGSVAPAWRARFERLERGAFHGADGLGPRFAPPSLFDPGRGRNGRPAPARAADAAGDVAQLQDRADQLARAYRVRGHLVAKIDPLELPRPAQPELDPAFYGFEPADMSRAVSTTSITGGDVQTLGELLERLRRTYCGSIGVQFMHIDDLALKRWLQERMENTENRIVLTREEQLRILTRLTDAVIFEDFVQKKFLGAKSFSLEGCESLIPLLDLAIEFAGGQGTDEIVLAMAHRGRLNVLANILGKGARRIFREFEDVDPELSYGRGDVKYHLGHSSDWTCVDGKKVHLSLCFNPSHLEYVSPVALGRLRAKQDRWGDVERTKGLAVIMHGDAAFAAEGVVQETLNLSELEGYRTGGTLHVVINNQIGFTTTPREGRSTTYATDVARMLQIPIFHVNGEDPTAVARVVRLALEFRSTWRRDVVIDMYGYRRRGHNEGDEPAFTDPLLYAAIARRKNVREGYVDHLLELGQVTREEADEIARARRAHLESELSAARSDDYVALAQDSGGGAWRGYLGDSEREVPRVQTGVEPVRARRLLAKLADVPEGFHPHPKLERFLDARRAMAAGEKPLDWSTAEALAFASLATEGHPLRLSGQDSQRGTFSQRHAVLHDVTTGRTWMPLGHLSDDQARVEMVNSPLSEAGVLGFDYGYRLAYPEALVLWEAQFGDFFNAAQVIIDQFLASAEDKWKRLSGLVLLLPHGFEGQGPEHSSARLERFLLLAADENLQIVQPTTPAQYLHVLRRQIVRPWRKPLVVMTPKSLLRHPRCVSTLDDVTSGGFRRTIGDADKTIDAASVRRVLVTSGKLYYELEAAREERGVRDVALVRLEQYYPLDPSDLESLLAPYPASARILWVQEEPENMGAWRYLLSRFARGLPGGRTLNGIYRRASASPATGSAASHKLEQAELIAKALDPD